MPQVPSLDAPSVQQEPLPGRPFPRIDENVSDAAYGAPLAQGIDAVSSAVTQEAAKQKVLNDNLRVIDANTQLEAGRDALLYGQINPKTGQREGGAFALHGTNAINLPARLQPEFQKVADGISQNLTPDQQRLFHGHVAATQNELSTSLNRYEYAEGQRLATETFSNGLKQAQEGASVGWRDPAVIGKSRQDIKGLIAMQGQHEGWPQDEIDQQTQTALAGLHFSVIDRMLADGKPQAALQYFVGTKKNPGVRDSGELTGEQSHQLGSAIDAAVKQQQAQGQTAIAAQLKDVNAAAMNGQLIPPGSMPSRGAVIAAFPENGSQIYDAIQKNVALGADIKSFSTMTPQEMQARVASYKPTDVAGAADAYERFNIADNARKNVMAARAADPRQAAIDNKLGSTPIDFKNTDATLAELNTRLASQPLDDRRMGGYVPPFSRQEAEQLSQQLENMTPKDRVGVLTSLNQGITVPGGYQEVMKQILPNSPVSSVAGTMLGHADPAQKPTWFDGKYVIPQAQTALVLAGEQLLNPQGQEKDGNKKTAMKMPEDGGYGGLRDRFFSQAGNMFQGRQELAEATYSVFKDAYAALLAKSGTEPSKGSTTLRDQAINIALGNRQDFNGTTVAIPQGMDPTRFRSVVNASVDFEGLRQGAKSGLSDRLSGYRLREIGEVGSGRYVVMNGSEDFARPDGKLGPNGAPLPLTIDVRHEFGGQQNVEAAPVSRAAVTKPATAEPKAEAPGPVPAGRKGKAGKPSQAPTL